MESGVSRLSLADNRLECSTLPGQADLRQCTRSFAPFAPFDLPVASSSAGFLFWFTVADVRLLQLALMALSNCPLLVVAHSTLLVACSWLNAISNAAQTPSLHDATRMYNLQRVEVLCCQMISL